MFSEYLLEVLDWIGTVAFAVSGALVAIACSLDLFGVIIVGCVTAVGGGMLRDLLMGTVPPQIFYSHTILLTAFVTTLIVFFAAYINAKRFSGLREKTDRINIVFDAVGLGAFSVTGVGIACDAGFGADALFVITMGVITGVGGGVLRDVLVNEKPYILTKHIYAVASIIGSSIYYVMATYTTYKAFGVVAAVVITILIRLFAAKYRWKLPKIKFDK